jgi:hypothetical protein
MEWINHINEESVIKYVEIIENISYFIRRLSLDVT